MTFLVILLGIFSLNAARGNEYDSAEANKIEVTPFYDTIIFSDVADLINEFGKNVNEPLDTLINSASESDENIEDLLSEYQQHLDRAYKQRINYLEKTINKNKVPLIRHERYSKTKPGSGVKYDDYYYSNGYLNVNKVPQTLMSNPLDIFIPINKGRFINKHDFTMNQPHEELKNHDKKLMELSPAVIKPRHDPIKSSCICKSDQIPCDCKCKQCLISLESMPPNNRVSKTLVQNPVYNIDDKLHDIVENGVKINIKVDIQLPKMPDLLGKVLKTPNHEEDGVYSKESNVSNLNLPFSYFNFPIPIDLFGHQRTAKLDSPPFHKITVHKKKKSRLSNSNKKHRKKVFAIQNIKIEPQEPITYHNNLENYSLNDNQKGNNSSLTVSPTANTTFVHKAEATFNFSNTTTNKTDEPLFMNETHTEDSIFLMVNISNNHVNGTEDNHKTENSVETEYTKTDSNAATQKRTNFRKKRDTSTPITPVVYTKNNTNLKTNKTLQAKIGESKKTDKGLFEDRELLYWPNNTKNQSAESSKNITSIILDRENKKSKLNMTKETIRHNRTRALEKAIFGEVNWDDVDTVAPVFMSFVGKYMRGALTFCSQNICHSMKCAEKTCVHRTCVPDVRWNHRGHCAGSNTTDSVASLESIMDLPSNIAFEIVDILQDKMLGKLFGKVTLCISSKCISFVAAKKNFLKSKCSMKELNKAGHCPNTKLLQSTVTGTKIM